MERGKIEQARKSLVKIHGSELESDATIENELAEIVKSSEIAKAINQKPFVTIIERQYRPHLVMSIAIPFSSK